MRHLSLLTLLIAAAFFLVTRPSIRGNDGVQNYAYLHSVLFDNDLDFTNQYAWYFTRQAGWFNEQEIPKDPTTGLPINLYGVGSSLLWTPWVLAGHGTGYLLNAAGFPVHLNGFSYLYEVAVGLGSCFYASIGLWLLVRLLRRRAGPEPAFWSVLLIWLASPLFFYMYLHPSMSHANSFFLSSLLLYLYLEKSQGRRSRVTWGLMGAVAGLLVITRFQDAALLSILAVGELLRGRESKWDTLDEAAQPEQLPFSSDQHRAASHLPPRLPSYGCFALCFMIALIPQLIAWHILQGSALSGPRGYISQGTIRLWAPIHAPDVLFSSRHGLFFWHPGLLMAFAGLLIAGRFNREKMMGLAGFACTLWIVSSWSIWWAGASFGHRMFISALPLLAMGGAFLFELPGRWAWLLRVLTLALILWNFGYVVQYGASWIDRQKAVPFSELAYNNLVRLPAAALASMR